jgi:hypothetical protein
MYVKLILAVLFVGIIITTVVAFAEVKVVDQGRLILLGCVSVTST